MIVVQGLGKVYTTPAGGYEALADVELRVDEGEFVALIGRSGSGKSTLLNIIGGIDAPTSGQVRVGETDLGSLDEAGLSIWRGATVGFVFQSFQLLPSLTALENVMLPMDFAGQRPAAERRERARALLEQVGLSGHEDKLPATLSGGEQQRVALARALANDPPVILADEPSGNLDSSTAADVVEMLRVFSAQGKTVLVVTHDTTLTRIADRTLELHDGRIADREQEGMHP
ncbi:MAG: ABC transporter ATP-binding protein [Myxococcales bacterium]|nr:ABC transporter ATP-binding protein [Myxococcales bacterium]